MTNETTDISQIADATQLKAMAYDQIALKEQVERNLAALNQRIAQVAQAELAPELETPED